MDKKLETIIDTTIERFNIIDVEVKGVLVCDKNGLVLATKNVSIAPGPIARLAELAAELSGRRTTVCLENNEDQVLINQTEKAVVGVYTKHAS
ncbi:unnamed protein product [Adineta ricciae]|uniref:Late endosomal/lysosomal adaptor and MAPK and MTOR activator 5 n=1 Tax=Adineta ricciae TaxID=249248 RepID=A0A814NV69_ADIRI|nr:unnamed protein product [Adineta ricciae]